MKIVQLNKLIVAILMLTTGATVSCSHAPLTPSQTVQHFWAALINGDLESAKQYTASESISMLSDLQKDFVAASVSFGNVKIESQQARIETTLSYKLDTGSKETKTVTFDTVLDKQQEDWKVNYAATQKSLEDARRKKGLSKLVDDLGKLGRDVSGQLDGVIKNWEKVTPEIKKDLEELGGSMQKQLQDSIDKHGPEIQKKLQEFSESLDDALKDLQKGIPKERKEDDKAQEPEGRMI